MRKRLLSLVLLPALAAGVAWWFRAPLETWWRDQGIFQQTEKPKPDPETYAVLIRELERWRGDLSTRHRQARTDEARLAVENDARALLEQALPAMMRCWLGTPWDFHGTAEGPGAGKIACGYFVATVLRDAGFQVDRYQLAKQPSENILRSFLPKKSCSLTVGRDYETFAAEVEKLDHGIHLVGLDTHVAFIVVDETGFRFIHSSGSRPWCVVDETRGQANVLRRSRWRMLGNLTADPAVLRRWLREEKIAVRGA